MAEIRLARSGRPAPTCNVAASECLLIPPDGLQNGLLLFKGGRRAEPDEPGHERSKEADAILPASVPADDEWVAEDGRAGDIYRREAVDGYGMSLKVKTALSAQLKADRLHGFVALSIRSSSASMIAGRL